ncbi:MAG: hypothetical protein ABEI77_00865 [Halorientalis sp.]
MRSLRAGALLTVAFCCLLAGCAVPTADESHPSRNVSVTVSNQADSTYAVRIMLVTGDIDAVAVTYPNGTTRRLAVDAVADIPPARLRNATDFRILGVNTKTRRDTLAPGSGTGATYTAVPTNTSVVYHLVPSAEAPTGSWGVLQCGDSTVMDVSITINPNRTYDVDNRCSDTPGRT